MLEEYFRNIRLNDSFQKGEKVIISDSISNTEFNQIYKKLETKIKKKLEEQESGKKL